MARRLISGGLLVSIDYLGEHTTEPRTPTQWWSLISTC